MAEAILLNGGGGGTTSDELTAMRGDVLKGKTAVTSDSDDEAAAGTMEDKSGTTQSAAASLDSGNSRVQMTIPATGKYSTASKLCASFTAILDLIGLTAAKIAIGNTILGRAGTYKGLGNAGTGDVLAGKTFSTASLSNSTGTMPNRGAVSQALGINGTYTIPQGYHNGYGKVYQNIGTMSGQTITPSKSQQTISCSGKYMNGNIVVNAIPNIKTAITDCVSMIWSAGSAYVRLARGYYDNNATSGYPETRIPADVIRNALGITADKIVKGYNIAEVNGTAWEMKQFIGRVTPVAATKTFTDIEGTPRTCYYLDLDLGFYPMAVQAVRNDGGGLNYYFFTGDQYNLCVVDMNARKPHWFSYSEPNICWQSTHIYLPVLTYGTAAWDVNIVGHN